MIRCNQNEDLTWDMIGIARIYHRKRAAIHVDAMEIRFLCNLGDTKKRFHNALKLHGKRRVHIYWENVPW